jgi:hypothetical protein
MHRVVLNISDGKKIVDHKNHDGLDNRKENLRVCTNAENMANTKPRKGSSSKYLGVHWNKESKKWQAQIEKGNKSTYLGLHVSEEAAAEAYNEAAIRIHGEFAYLNKILAKTA